MDSKVKVKRLISEKSIIFWDFDGVIKESVEIKTKAFVQLFSSFGKNVAELVKFHHEANGGMSRYNKFPIYLKWSGVEPTQNIIEEYNQKFNLLVFSEVLKAKWVEGVEEFLRTNKYNQLFVLVSATPQSELELIVKELDLDRLFIGIYGAPTSKVSAIAEMLKKLNKGVSQALMIGDARADRDAAIANNISFLLRRHESNIDVFSDYKDLSILNFKGI